MAVTTSVVSLSLAPALRDRLDREARRQRRSRSFVVAEAIEAYLRAQEREAFGEARSRTLREGLALSPAERLRLSEELWQEFALQRGPAAPWTAAFDTFEEHERWRRGGGAWPGG